MFQRRKTQASFQTVSCRFGSERFDVHADCAIAALFDNEFCDPERREPEIVFQLRRDDSRQFRSEYEGFQEHGISYSNRYCEFFVRFGNPSHVSVWLKRSRRMSLVKRLPQLLQRVLTRKFNTVDEQEYGYFVYKAVLWMLFLHSIRSGRLFLHASGFVSDAKGVLLCGSGGVGKTSLSAMLLQRPGTKFVSDDIVSVSRDGFACANGMFVHAYPYNDLKASVWTHSTGWCQRLLDRAHWRVRRMLFGPKGVCRRISPFELHECAPASPNGNALSYIIWLKRGGTNQDGMTPVADGEFAASHLDVLKIEMRSAFEFYVQAKLDGWSPQESGMPVSLEGEVVKGLDALARSVPVRRFVVSTDRTAAQNAKRLVKLLQSA